jgi:hypothetical protein
MAIRVKPSELTEFNAPSPSFKEWLSFFETRVSDFYSMIPTCLTRFECALLDGDVAGNRRGIHGIALRFDAEFYLERLVAKAKTAGR